MLLWQDRARRAASANTWEARERAVEAAGWLILSTWPRAAGGDLVADFEGGDETRRDRDQREGLDLGFAPLRPLQSR